MRLIKFVTLLTPLRRSNTVDGTLSTVHIEADEQKITCLYAGSRKYGGAVCEEYKKPASGHNPKSSFKIEKYSV